MKERKHIRRVAPSWCSGCIQAVIKSSCAHHRGTCQLPDLQTVDATAQQQQSADKQAFHALHRRLATYQGHSYDQADDGLAQAGCIPAFVGPPWHSRPFPEQVRHTWLS